MTPPAFLAKAGELDAEIQVQDRLLLLSHTRQVPASFLRAQLAVRNDLTRAWANLWNTRPVSEVGGQ